MVLLSQIDVGGGVLFAERWRAEADEQPVELADGRSIRTTLSIGVASYAPIFKDGGELIAAADAALYQAKESGRNQVVVYEP
jgi:diguanylate cyclase (GGDEF)-like protein